METSPTHLGSGREEKDAGQTTAAETEEAGKFQQSQLTRAHIVETTVRMSAG